jgi:hypothetical protein
MFQVHFTFSCSKKKKKREKKICNESESDVPKSEYDLLYKKIRLLRKISEYDYIESDYDIFLLKKKKIAYRTTT